MLSDDIRKKGPQVRSSFSPRSPRKIAVAAVSLVAALSMVACGNGEEEQEEDVAATESEETTETSAEYQPREVAPIVVETSDFAEPAYDPGLNVEFHFQGTSYGNYGGTVVHVAVTNLNDVALPTDAIDTPRLSYSTGSGMEDVPLLQTEVPETAPPLHMPLDLPLGVGATTNLHYTFEVSRGNLYNAEFQIGNVIYRGNLVV